MNASIYQSPWQQPNLYPPARLKDGRLGVWHEGQVEAMTLEGILAGVLQDLGEKDGKHATRPIGWVEVPGQDRVVDVIELPEVQALMRDHLDGKLSQAVKQQGWITWIAGPLILGAAVAGLNLGYLSIQVISSGQAWWEALHDRRSLRKDPDLFFAHLSAKRRFEYWVSRVRWYVHWRTWFMTALFTSVFLMQLWAGMDTSVSSAALVKPEVWNGQVWRLLSASLMHGSIMHILMNGFAWLSLAVLIERAVQPTLLVPVFLLSALGGNVASLFLAPTQSSLGASGGILGLVGFLLVAGWRRKELLPPGFSQSLVRAVASIGVLGLVAWKMIDNAAHAGGLLAGSSIGMVVFAAADGPLPLPSTGWWRVLDGFCTAVVLASTARIALRLLSS
jgi:membrane associated rhomboid family serine protease